MEVLGLLLDHGADPTLQVAVMAFIRSGDAVYSKTICLQDHHGRDPYRVALRNNNAAVAGNESLLEKTAPD